MKVPQNWNIIQKYHNDKIPPQTNKNYELSQKISVLHIWIYEIGMTYLYMTFLLIRDTNREEDNNKIKMNKNYNFLTLFKISKVEGLRGRVPLPPADRARSYTYFTPYFHSPSNRLLALLYFCIVAF